MILSIRNSLQNEFVMTLKLKSIFIFFLNGILLSTLNSDNQSEYNDFPSFPFEIDFRYEISLGLTTVVICIKRFSIWISSLVKSYWIYFNQRFLPKVDVPWYKMIRQVLIYVSEPLHLEGTYIPITLVANYDVKFQIWMQQEFINHWIGFDVITCKMQINCVY